MIVVIRDAVGNEIPIRSIATLEDLINAGQIDADTLIRAPKSRRWEPASRHPMIASLLGIAPSVAEDPPEAAVGDDNGKTPLASSQEAPKSASATPLSDPSEGDEALLANSRPDPLAAAGIAGIAGPWGTYTVMVEESPGPAANAESPAPAAPARSGLASSEAVKLEAVVRDFKATRDTGIETTRKSSRRTWVALGLVLLFFGVTYISTKSPTGPDPAAKQQNPTSSAPQSSAVPATKPQSSAASGAQKNAATGVKPDIAAIGHTASPGTRFRDCPDCPEMIVVPSGRFLMGATVEEDIAENLMEQFQGISSPRREVTINSGWALSRYEITVAEYRIFRRVLNRPATGCSIYVQGQFRFDKDKDWNQPGFEQADRSPVVRISWNDAIAYTVWLSTKTGRTYRLPSEAEWEFAARAGSKTARPWGVSANDACEWANVSDRSARELLKISLAHECDDGAAFTSIVGTHKPNAFGLFDMIGNAWELVHDCWRGSLSDTPANGMPHVSGSCGWRTIRGGGWNSSPGIARSATRASITESAKINDVGLRVVAELQ